MASPFDSQNPYLAPHGPQSQYGATATAGLPGFIKAMAIVDLVFCCIRAVLVGLSILGYFMLVREQSPLLGSVLAEIATGLLIAAFGIPANILLLLRKPAGLWIAMVAVVGAVGAMGVAGWQTSVQAIQFPPGSPQRAGFFIAVAFVTLIRLGLLGLYIGALVQFANWSRRHLPKPTMF